MGYESSVERFRDLVPPNTIFHEVSHYYYLHGPGWVVEGWAEFMGESVASSLGYRSYWEVDPRLTGEYGRCEGHGWENLYVLATLRDVHPDGGFCSYPMARRMLTRLFDEWGETAFVAALRDMYRWSAGHADDNGRPSPEELEHEIYEVLRVHAPAGREEEFRALYYELNGGPYTVAIPTPAPVPEEVASRMAEVLPWAAGPQDDDHGAALQAVARLWQLDPALGGGSPGTPGRSTGSRWPRRWRWPT